MSRRLAALHEPEDVLQDTLLFALQARPTLELGRPARAWLGALAEIRILTLAARSRRRTRPRRSTALPPDQLTLDPEAIDRAASSPDEARDEREAALAGLAALERLPFEPRVGLVLRNFAGLPWSTIGAVLGCSPEAARSQYRRTLDALAPLDPPPR